MSEMLATALNTVLSSGLHWFSSRTQTLPRKEVIQPHVPVRLPCYDFVPVADFILDACLPKVGAAALDAADSHDVTGGVYKARERIHRRMLTGGY